MSETMTCAECGMLVSPPSAFHPYLYCWLFKRGVKDPGRFLADYGFVRGPVKFDRTEVQTLQAVVVELESMLDGFPARGAHTRARWAIGWIEHLIEKAEGNR